MAALNFPPSPALNDIFTSGDRSWKYNGVAWQLMPRTTDNITEGTTNLYYTDARVAAAPAVTALQSDLASEISTRTSEISRIDDRVNNVLENLDPVKIDSFTEVLSKLASDKSELSDAIVALGTGATSGLGEETAARIAADSDLQDAIDAEVTRAQGVESQISSDLAAEVTARQQAISTEQADRAAAILAEQTARETAISTEQAARAAAILAEQTARETAISSVNTRVDNVLENLDPVKIDSFTEVLSQLAADKSELSDAIVALGTGATSALGDETAARIAADADLQDAIDAEATRAQGVESQISSDLAAEVTARQQAISTETSAREAAILAEQTARETAISSVNTRVDNVLENLDPVKIDSFTEVLSQLASDKSELSDAIVALGTGANSALGDETAARIAADDAINTTVSTLTDSIPDRVRAVLLTGLSLATNAAISATDSVLDAFGKLQAQVTAAFTSIDSEVSTRTSEISRVDTRIDAQDTRLTSAEGTIAGLGTMSTQDASNVNITGGTITGVNVNAGSMEVGQGGTADLYVGLDGKVGIGTEAPTEKLTVNGHIDITGGRLKNLGAPVDATDAVTKGYVDTAVSGVQSALDTEISDRTSEVSRLDGLIATEISDRTAAVQNLEDTKQIKLVVSDTAPAHVEGREWVDTTDFRRYLSVSGAWIESVTA
jgi:Icc-related predicted phosphoesterase